MASTQKCPACNGQGFTRWKGEDGACDVCQGSGERTEGEPDLTDKPKAAPEKHQPDETVDT